MKNFIQLMLLCILLAFSFGIPTNTFAQIQADPQAPCSLVLGEHVVWDGPYWEYLILPCGCKVTFSYFNAYTQDDVPIVSVADIIVEYAQGTPACSHNFVENLPSGHTRDFGDIDLRTYIEIRLVEYLSNEEAERFPEAVITTNATCYKKWVANTNPDNSYVTIDASSIGGFGLYGILPGKINPKDNNSSDRILSLFKVRFDEYLQPCDGDICCIYKFELGWDIRLGIPEIPDPERAQFINKVHKYNLGDYSIPLEACPPGGCEYTCENIDYNYDMWKGKDVITNDNKVSVITILPNPAQDKINISFDNSNFKGNIRVEVYDYLGGIVLSLDSQYEHDVLEVDVSNLSSGAYLVKLYNEGTYIATEKLIISK
jgi:hypothetical protein